MLYCTAPGLAMWVLDWGMRFYELRQRLDATLSSLGSGWYCLSLGLPRRRLDGCACSSPLAHFYIHHSKSSTRELHPFTTITHLASQNLVTSKASEKIPIRFLFRKSTQSTQLSDEFARKDGFAKIVGLFGKERKSHSEWTDKLASLADTPDQLSPEGRIIDRKVQTSLNPASSVELGPTDPLRTADIPVRLEGPYFTPVSPSEYNTVVCLVAGTGISGAIAIAGAFAESKMSKFRCEHRGIAHRRACSSRDSSSRKWKRCIIVWSVRDEHYIDLPFFQELKSSGLEVQTHLTGEGRSRLDMVETLQSIHKDDSGSLWVYLSGPNRFIEAGEKACRALAGVDWFAARWD
ncbi:hypothetical protein MMC20_002362, partial [Loxospora ochrophaea]|nr:hypothetical protein [Loxospora ochrophaea]